MKSQPPRVAGPLVRARRGCRAAGGQAGARGHLLPDASRDRRAVRGRHVPRRQPRRSRRWSRARPWSCSPSDDAIAPLSAGEFVHDHIAGSRSQWSSRATGMPAPHRTRQTSRSSGSSWALPDLMVHSDSPEGAVTARPDLFDAAPCGYVVMDDDGPIVRANVEFLRMVEGTADDRGLRSHLHQPGDGRRADLGRDASRTRCSERRCRPGDRPRSRPSDGEQRPGAAQRAASPLRLEGCPCVP